MKGLPQKWKTSVHWYLLGAMVALELLMSFSFLGYFHVEPISITIAYIPVLLAGALMGPVEAMCVGLVFGLASMWKASASYIMDLDRLFSPVTSGHPLESILLSVGSRALFGLLIGLLYLAARHARHKKVWVGVVSYLGRPIHSFLVYGAMWLCFPQAGYTPLKALDDLDGLNDVVGNLFSVVIVLLLWRLMHSPKWEQFLQRVELAEHSQLVERYHRLSLVGIILVALLSSVAVAFYFVQRMASVLNRKGIVLSNVEYSDLFHLQLQFLFGILAMMTLLIIFLVFNRRYSTYMDRESKMDPLTGAMNRKSFFQSCKKMLAHFQNGRTDAGYFIMVDMDGFKQINDSYGHPEGDRVLKETVRAMNVVFGRDGFVGRVGGDEFAIFLYGSMQQEELEGRLLRFLELIRHIRQDSHPVSCSIGVQPVDRFCTAEELYQEADSLLYQAKKQGKNRYVFGSKVQALHGEQG